MVLPPNVTMGRHYGGRWEETGRDKVMAFLWARDERVAKGHKKNTPEIGDSMQREEILCDDEEFFSA